MVITQCNGLCPNGWFGSKCQFQCHCDNSQCPPGGQCIGRCAQGWFGESCQFQDLATVKGVSVVTTSTLAATPWMADKHNRTCNTRDNVQSITLTWDRRFFIYSVRIAISDEALLTSVTTNCGPTTHVIRLDEKTLEYRCNAWTTKGLILSGAGLRSLCSLFVNGGRNVALKQNARQTSVMGRYMASLAVDGNTNGQFQQDSCTHTEGHDASPAWTLVLDTPKKISRLVLYNRQDCCIERLTQFKLQAMGSSGDVVFAYNVSSLSVMPLYDVTVHPSKPIVQITISTALSTLMRDKYGYQNLILTLCEVELYGDCAPGTWGLECDKVCPTQCNDSCHHGTGECYACLGYSNPPECSTECCSGRWGFNCQQNCSMNCLNELCNIQTGLCEQGCYGAVNFPYCDTGLCPNGWFGSKCQFQCHCDNSQCPSDGQCIGRCAQGWFGESCQLQDLATVKGVSVVTTPTLAATPWMADKNNRTCHTRDNVQSITLTWDRHYFIYSVRIAISDEALLTSVTTNCGPITHVVRLDEKTLEYRCNAWATKGLILSGAGLRSLCSLFVNGGRNVALKQNATQTSVMGRYMASLAVDGNTNGQFQYNSCTHTEGHDASPAWTLVLDTPKKISRFVLYNRQDCCIERLTQFKLQAMGSSGDVVFAYNVSSLGVMPLYDVTVHPSEPIVQITISTALSTLMRDKYGHQNHILTLCEVELNGDCAPGTWGLECDKVCPTQCNDSCHHGTGKCYACLGYSNPPECSTECCSGRWGFNCQQNCSMNCLNELCNIQTGLCEQGCSGAVNFPYCDTACPKGKWGVNCSRDCDVRCWAESCHPVTGRCDSGCNGYSDPPNCIVVCSPGTWGGPDCAHQCSSRCSNQMCDPQTGQCQSGCDGYSDPPTCQKACDIHTWGLNCNSSCSQKCFNSTCNSVTGLCDSGCNVYTDAPFCTKAYVVQSFLSGTCTDETMTMKLNFEHGVSIGIATGVLVMIIIDAFIVCVLCFRRKGRQDTGTLSMPYNKLCRPVSTAPPYTEMSLKATSCTAARDSNCDLPGQEMSTKECQESYYEIMGGLCGDLDNSRSENVNIYNDMSQDTPIYNNM
ncbi:hypothetical protein Btru_032161 [Bulinus truncatus]|nr:hypothetical protein Btru_032161 [Bulinus truncatus]